MAGELFEHFTPVQRVSRDETDKAFREVFKTAAGKRVLFWILEQCAIYEDAFAGENTATTNYTLGRQAAGRRLIAQMDRIDPTMYPQLLRDIAEIRELDRSAARSLAGKLEGDDED